MKMTKLGKNLPESFLDPVFIIDSDFEVYLGPNARLGARFDANAMCLVYPKSRPLSRQTSPTGDRWLPALSAGPEWPSPAPGHLTSPPASVGCALGPGWLRAARACCPRARRRGAVRGLGRSGAKGARAWPPQKDLRAPRAPELWLRCSWCAWFQLRRPGSRALSA